MKEAIEQYVDREEKREKVRLDVMATWEHYQETGLHLTAQEADAWLEKLAAGEDADVPECHTCHGRLRPWRTSVDLVAFCVPKAPTPPAEQ